MTREKAIEMMMDFYNENYEKFVNDLNELDSYNGCLDGSGSFLMADIDNLLEGRDVLEIINMISHDFYTGDDYFYINDYGMLHSESEYEMTDRYINGWFTDDILGQMIDYSSRLYLTDEIENIINDIDE